MTPADTIVHLVGTPHPSPAKAAEFRAVDLPSIHASVEAASAAGVSHLVYVSVAHPAPIMKAYIDVRSAGESAIAAAGLTATVHTIAKAARSAAGGVVSNHVYKTIELVGSSPNGTDDAVRNAIARAGETIRNLRWFQVVETRGHLEDGRIGHWQVTLKVGFTLE